MRKTKNTAVRRMSSLQFFTMSVLVSGFSAFCVWWLTGNSYLEGGLGTALILGTLGLMSACLIAGLNMFAVRGSLAELNADGETIATSVSHLVDASQFVSSASTEQAASIQEAVATLTELSASIRKNAEYAEKSHHASTLSHRVAQQGQSAVENMIQCMDQINDSNTTIVNEIERGYERIADIVHVITEISQKTKVINDIVFQTKLLSFNASVEAARAGDHGKGFAIVAEEIGNLAKMSGNASRDISTMLSKSINTVNTIVQETSEKVRKHVEVEKTKVNSGIKVANRCGEILGEAVVNVSTVNTMLSEISKATNEQAQAINEISTAMAELDKVTQQNADTAQRAAEYSANISWKAENLRSALNRLRAVLHPADFIFGSRRTYSWARTSSHVNPPAKGHAKVIPLREMKNEKQKTLLEASGSNVPLGEDPDFEDV